MMSVSADFDKITNTIDSFQAQSGTDTPTGMLMAEKVLEAHKNDEYAAGQKYNKVVIVFSDGMPGKFLFDWDTARSIWTTALRYFAVCSA